MWVVLYANFIHGYRLVWAGNGAPRWAVDRIQDRRISLRIRVERSMCIDVIRICYGYFYGVGAEVGDETGKGADEEHESR